MTIATDTTRDRKRLPPLQHGDHLTRDEFEWRWELQPELKKAELLNGMVFLASEHTGRTINPKIPPLENGDHLSRDEFERRWDNMPDLKNAERLNGMVFMPPPLSAEDHGVPHSRLMFWLGVYWSATPEVILADNSTLYLQSDDDPQPDAMLFVRPEHGGRTRYDPKGYAHGVPELIAEVAASSVNYDLHLKRDVYSRNQVPEYVVWSVYEEVISWMVFDGADYRPLLPDADGLFRSRVFPGLWLDPRVLIAGDLAAVLRVAQQGTATAEHSAFRQRLGNLSRD
jgi:hypothetical protein